MDTKSNFYIIAVGLSAGGYQPLWDFFSQIPTNSGMAFVVITHLNRAYISIADKLLAKHTAMPIHWAMDQQVVRPNNIYLLPPNKLMTIQKGRLQLWDRKPEELSNWAVDIFFHSLANTQKNHAIGVILSGAGSDGALGALHIHDEEGVILVQEPQTAEFSSMPWSAIFKDSPEAILAPKELAQALLKFVVSAGIPDSSR